MKQVKDDHMNNILETQPVDALPFSHNILMMVRFRYPMSISKSSNIPYVTRWS